MSAVQDTLNEAIQSVGRHGSYLTGWVVIAEWIDSETGDKLLSRLTSESAPTWVVQGYLHNALYEDWGDERKLTDED